MNKKSIIVLAFLLIVFFLELQVTLRSPIAFGDEGYHESAARYIGKNLEYPIYTPLHGSPLQEEKFSRLPLWNFLEASFYMVGISEASKILIPLISILIGFSMYVVLTKIYSRNLGMMSTFLTISVPSFLTYSVLFYTQLLFVFYSTLALLFFMLAIKTERRRFWFLTSMFLILSFLTNIAATFVIAALLLYGLKEIITKRDLPTLKTYGLVVLLFFLFVSPFFLRNIVLYKTDSCKNLKDIIMGSCPDDASYQSNFAFEGRTVAGGSEEGVFKFGITNYIEFAYGYIWFVPLLFFAGLFLFLKYRDKADYILLLIVVIFILGFYQTAGLIEGRSEDTIRYFLSTVPIAAIIGAKYIEHIANFLKKYRKELEFLIIFIIIIISLILVNNKLFGYSTNGGQVGGLINVKQFVPSFFQTCDWVRRNLPENAYLLSLHTYPTMYNCQRGAAWEVPYKSDILLSNDLNLTINGLKKNSFTHIFVQKFSMTSQALGQGYSISFVQLLENNRDKFEKVYEIGPDLNTCLSAGGCDGEIVYKIIY